MKSLLLCLIITVLLVIPGNVSYAETTEPTDTVVKFYEAAKDGDIKTMKRLVAGPFYNSRKVLLEKNKGYPKFLREYYEGIEAQVVYAVVGNDALVKKNHPKLYKRYCRKIKTPSGDNSITRNNSRIAVVGVKLQHTDGNNFNTKLLLRKDNNDTWRIVAEILAD